jgi:glycosyltransferase involved in cell wall biosynthesis
MRGQNNRKKIAVNTRFLIKNKLEGIGLFTYETLKRITLAHPEVDFYFLFDRKYDAEFIFGKNVYPVVLFPQARHPFLWYWWFEISVAGWLKNNNPDLFVSPDGYACLDTKVPQVLVIHDLAFEHFNNHVYGLVRYYYRYYMPRFARAAARIATVSKFSKNDIMQQYHIDAGNIDIVYNGAKEIYKPADETTKQRIKKQYTDGEDYFVYLGAIHPRKNVKNLLLAFDKFKSESNDKQLKLLLIGRKAWDFSDVDGAYEEMRFKRDVKFLGHLAPTELVEILGSAMAMTYVSLFEGFGIPIVEAMSCGVPVITSNVTSMPEVAGDAALLINPESVAEIAAAMEKMASDEELRKTLIEKGNKQVLKFSWQLSADKLWACFEKVM